jgi:hypothetical protein
MMIGFLENKMTLKTTLPLWEPMVTCNGLVSCVIGLDQRLQPSLISTGIGMFFFTKANLYCHISSLSIKHVDAPKLRSVWASIVTSLLHLTMIGSKKHGIGFKDKMGPFSLHDASRFNLAIPTKTEHACFLTAMVVGW